MDDIRLAMIGNKEAAKRLTEKGVLVPCPGCGRDDLKEHCVFNLHFVGCLFCGWTGPTKNSHEEARLAWNTRAKIGEADERSL